MRVALVNCFDTYEDRTECLYSYFMDKGYEVCVIEPDFQHIKKVKEVKSKIGYIQLDVPPYKKNLSVQRLKSHNIFAKKTRKKIMEIEPDLIYALIPPNSLVKELVEYKLNNPRTKIIFDIMDLWPETMPIPLVKKWFPFSLWRQLRDRYIKYADYIVTECDLFYEVLKNILDENKTSTMYLVRKDSQIKATYIKRETLDIGYVGSINNIIDIQTIQEVLKQLSVKYRVNFHVIGRGESKDNLIQQAKDAGATVIDYGVIYDKKKKMEIFSQCDFGLNIMKKTVCVGLTTKSIDYFEAGLPIINNIQGDTFGLVKNHGVGINIDSNGQIDLDTVSKMKVEMDVIRDKVNQLYQEKFLYNVFATKMDEILQKIM